jgi:hypothetical protein
MANSTEIQIVKKPKCGRPVNAPSITFALVIHCLYFFYIIIRLFINLNKKKKRILRISLIILSLQIENEVFEFKCSTGLLFDIVRQICDFKAKVDNCDVNTGLSAFQIHFSQLKRSWMCLCSREKISGQSGNLNGPFVFFSPFLCHTCRSRVA